MKRWKAAGYMLMPILLLVATAQAGAPWLPAEVPADEVPKLLDATAWVRSLDEAELVARVPEQSGLFFVGCPNCTAGRQERQLEWTPQRPDEVYCTHCDHRYPSSKYPATAAVVVRNPRGQVQRYPYWEDSSGYRYFFEARRHDHVKTHLTTAALRLAQLYQATGELSHARRAALILDRFAQVFPGWCYHYDYPHRQKEIYEGDVPPEQYLPGYRTARWSWWAYYDLPLGLLQTYDLLRGSGALEELSREQGVDVEKRIVHDLFRDAAEQVLANPEPFTNMSPRAWRSLIVAGRVIGEPRYVHEPVRRLRHLVETQFFYDGSWYEGSPDYAAQTLLGLDEVLDVLRGYSDPPGYLHPENGKRFDELNLEEQFPALRQAREALAKMRFPNGRHVTVHDTWSTTRRQPLDETTPYLLPALGHACLGGGAGDDQLQLHLTWSGGYGHQHSDLLSLILFAHGREMLSDIGYTHTRHHVWTLATAAHNTVVIDGLNQWMGSRQRPSDGSLRWFDARHPRVQTVSADGERSYPKTASLYRRTLVLVEAGGGARYVVDLFEVEGGKQHDYFLHGDADSPSTVTTEVELTPLATLLPAGVDWKPPRDEMERDRITNPYDGYGFLRELRAASVEAGQALAVTFEQPSGPALRATVFPQDNSTLILGRAPSVRNAKEDDARVDEFHRPFLLLRRDARNTPSHFVAVLEPYADQRLIRAIERIEVPGAKLALRIKLPKRNDLLVIGAPQPVSISAGAHEARFSGEVGLLSLKEEEVESAYVLGEGGWERGSFTLEGAAPQSKPLLEVKEDSLIIGHTTSPPASGDVVRLIIEDGWSYPFRITAAEADGERVRLRVAEGPGMSFDPATQNLKLRAFPQRQHTGPVQVNWLRSASTR